MLFFALVYLATDARNQRKVISNSAFFAHSYACFAVKQVQYA